MSEYKRNQFSSPCCLALLQFPHWTATGRCWIKNSVNLGSPVTPLILRPNSFRKTSDFGPIAPKDSMA